LGVQGAEIVLAFGVTLFGSLAKPFHRLSKVPWRALVPVVPTRPLSRHYLAYPHLRRRMLGELTRRS
jgi:hypothetical protein